MNYEIVNKCIKNSLARVKPCRGKMGVYAYIKYYCNRNYLTIEEEFYIRKAIKKYIKKNSTKIFDLNFTIEGLGFEKAC